MAHLNFHRQQEHPSKAVGTRLAGVKAVCVGAGEQAAVLTLKMKKSSMNMAPKGRIPAMRMLQENQRVNTARRPRASEAPDSFPSHPK